MGGDWRPSNWGEEVTLEYGKAIRGYSPTHGKYRVFGSNGPIGWTSEALTQGPGVILGRKGAYRGVEYWREPFWVIDTAYYLVPKTELDMRWLYYAVKHYKLGEVDDGSPIPSTTRAAVYMLELDVPPKPEQRAIAHILGTLDDKIELNRRRNQTLEAMARALFKDWFVDFGPVRAKMEGREPYLPADIWQLFPDRLDDEGKPEGWETKRISDYLSLAYGKSLPAGKRHQGDIPVYGSGGITGFHNEALVNGPAVIVGRKGTVGSLHWEDRPCFPIDTVFYVQPEAPLPFCYYLLESLPLRDMNTDAAVPGLNRENVYRLEVAAPPPELISDFAKTASCFRESIAEISKGSEALTQIRDTLLPELISGELRIADAEKFLEGLGL
jgi:type I restriction enzyme S subunit